MTTSVSPHPNPWLGRFSWLVLDTWVVPGRGNRDLACALLTAPGETGDLAEQAMPHLAMALGLDSRRGAHTEYPTGMYLAFTAEQVTLHLADGLELRRPVHPQWRQAAIAEGWARLVVSYVVMPPDTNAATFLIQAVAEGATATVPVHRSTASSASDEHP